MTSLSQARRALRSANEAIERITKRLNSSRLKACVLCGAEFVPPPGQSWLKFCRKCRGPLARS